MSSTWKYGITLFVIAKWLNFHQDTSIHNECTSSDEQYRIEASNHFYSTPIMLRHLQLNHHIFDGL